VEFILDGDTVLESDNYIDRIVEELYKGAGIASACGTVLPLRDRDRRAMLDTQALQKFLGAHPEATIYPKVGWFHHLQRGITDMYRDVLYFFLQKFVYVGQMAFFGSILNPVGCAVAYRRDVLKTIVFDRYEPILGDDLTNSEDIFIGFAMNDNGYRNIQLTDVYARSQEPEVGRVPGQIYLWSSSFLQSCYYFDELMRSPLKAFKRSAGGPESLPPPRSSSTRRDAVVKLLMTKSVRSVPETATARLIRARSSGVVRTSRRSLRARFVSVAISSSCPASVRPVHALGQRRALQDRHRVLRPTRK
jgi:hypothetical protein